MLTTEDKKEIREIIREETETIRASLVVIGRDRKILKDIWEFIKDHTRQFKDHDERISNLESSSKF